MRLRARERDDGDEEVDDNCARYCSRCKQHVSAECFQGLHRKTCASCLRRHEVYRRRKRRKRQLYVGRYVETQRAAARVHDVGECVKVKNTCLRIARAQRQARGVEPTARIYGRHRQTRSDVDLI